MAAKVVLITGCSSGLGRALAYRLHSEKVNGEPCYQVFASARNQGALKELEADGISTVQLDVTKQKSVDAAVKRVIQEAGRIDILINNAGLSRVGPAVEQPLSEFQEVMDTNLIGVVRVTQAVAPHMINQRCGLIVMIGSVVSMLASPFGGAYSASKAALLALSDSMRLELQPFGVQLTYVTAGAIKSSIAENILAGTNLARYERADSVYRPLADMIRARAEVSQDPKSAMSADAVADQIAAVVNGSMLQRRGFLSFLRGGSKAAAVAEERPVWRPRPPPVWFLAGGNATLYWAMGLLQKLSGSPTNWLLAKKFGLDKEVA